MMTAADPANRAIAKKAETMSSGLSKKDLKKAVKKSILYKIYIRFSQILCIIIISVFVLNK